MQRLLTTIVLLILLLAPVSALAEEAESSGKSFGHRLLFYIPNRIFDVFDLVRARVRVGPGLAVDARVTKYGDLYAAATALSLSVSMVRGRNPVSPGPSALRPGRNQGNFTCRCRKQRPAYGYGEVGVGFQAAIVGLM